MRDEILAKQAIYRSIHRGCKETDFLIGDFAKVKVPAMNQAALVFFIEFIEEDDMAIYDWILRKYDAPAKYHNLLEEIRVFHKV